MGVTAQQSDDGNTVTITVDGRFDFFVHKDFRNIYKDYDASVKFRVNLSGTEFLDSSALGMLLLLKKHSNNDVIIEKPNEEVKRVLTIANFDKVFNIE